MRFMHLADLHLGKGFGERALLDDQRLVLKGLVEVAYEKRVDAVLIAGDIYQRSAPQAEAMEVFDEFVSALSGKGIAVFAISGNHDSSKRISYFSDILAASNVYVSRKFEGRLQSVELNDEYGKIYIHMLPYLRASSVKLLYPDEKIENTADAVACVLKNSNVDYSARNVLVAHQYVTGAEFAGSEDMIIGTLDGVNVGLFDGFDYVALGHLHRAQKVGRENVRYAGTPIIYSFDEAKDIKSAAIVEIGQKGDVKVELVPIEQPHNVRKIAGRSAEILEMPYSEDYVWITLTDENVEPDARRTLTTVFPNMLRFSINNSKTSQDMDISGASEVSDLNAENLFIDFYSKQNNGVAPSEKHIELFRRLFGMEDEI